MYFVLVINGSKHLHTVASRREDALSQFGKTLGAELSDSPTGRVSSILLDEFDATPHWVNAQIPIWEKRKQGVIS